MSTFEFYDIEVNKDKSIDIVWQCEVCGHKTLNIGVVDVPPDICNNCYNDEENE